MKTPLDLLVDGEACKQHAGCSEWVGTLQPYLVLGFFIIMLKLCGASPGPVYASSDPTSRD